jgi:hypothetical protein
MAETDTSGDGNIDFNGLIFQPPQYNWNIIESGVTHYDPNPLFFN